MKQIDVLNEFPFTFSQEATVEVIINLFKIYMLGLNSFSCYGFYMNNLIDVFSFSVILSGM